MIGFKQKPNKVSVEDASKSLANSIEANLQTRSRNHKGKTGIINSTPTNEPISENLEEIQENIHKFTKSMKLDLGKPFDVFMVTMGKIAEEEVVDAMILVEDETSDDNIKPIIDRVIKNYSSQQNIPKDIIEESDIIQINTKGKNGIVNRGIPKERKGLKVDVV